jgi:hypothetical protein
LSFSVWSGLAPAAVVSRWPLAGHDGPEGIGQLTAAHILEQELRASARIDS